MIPNIMPLMQRQCPEFDRVLDLELMIFDASVSSVECSSLHIQQRTQISEEAKHDSNSKFQNDGNRTEHPPKSGVSVLLHSLRFTSYQPITSAMRCSGRLLSKSTNQ